MVPTTALARILKLYGSPPPLKSACPNGLKWSKNRLKLYKMVKNCNFLPIKKWTLPIKMMGMTGPSLGPGANIIQAFGSKMSLIRKLL